MRANTIKTRRGIFNIILTALAAISLSAIATPVSAAIGWPGPEEGQCNYGKWAQGLIIMGGSIEGVVDSKEEERPSSCNVPLEVELRNNPNETEGTVPEDLKMLEYYSYGILIGQPILTIKANTVPGKQLKSWKIETLEYTDPDDGTMPVGEWSEGGGQFVNANAAETKVQITNVRAVAVRITAEFEDYTPPAPPVIPPTTYNPYTPPSDPVAEPEATDMQTPAGPPLPGEPVVLPKQFVAPAPTAIPDQYKKQVDTGADAVVRAADRMTTSAYISLLPEFAQATIAVVVAGDSPIDGTSAAPLAAALKAPVLYSGQGDLGALVMQRVKMGIKELILVGSAQISPATEQELAAMGVKVRRIQGEDRYETSELVVDQIPGATQIFAADGTSLADSMVASVAAGQNNGAVALVKPGSAGNQANDNRPVTAIGGVAAQAYPQAKNKLFGANRYETANVTAKQFATPGAPVIVTSGARLVDAVPGSALAAVRGASIVYAAPGQNTSAALATARAMSGKNFGTSTYIGG